MARDLSAFNIALVLQCRNSPNKDKTVSQPIYLYNRNRYTSRVFIYTSAASHRSWYLIVLQVGEAPVADCAVPGLHHGVHVPHHPASVYGGHSQGHPLGQGTDGKYMLLVAPKETKTHSWLAPGRFQWNFWKKKIQTHFNNWWLGYLWWNFPRWLLLDLTDDQQ